MYKVPIPFNPLIFRSDNFNIHNIAGVYIPILYFNIEFELFSVSFDLIRRGLAKLINIVKRCLEFIQSSAAL